MEKMAEKSNVLTESITMPTLTGEDIDLKEEFIKICEKMTAGILKAQSQISNRINAANRIILHAGCTYHLIAEYFPII